jgi:hypothetical protein
MSKLPTSNCASITLSVKGGQMPEPSRSDAPLRNPQYPQGAEREEFSPGQPDFQQPHSFGSSFPSGDIYGQLHRSRAENFGRSIGSAVGGVLRFPLRVGQSTSRLRVAGNVRRAQASAVVLDMMDTAAQRAEHLRRTASATISQLEDQAAKRWEELRSAAKERLDLASQVAVERWNQTQRAVNRLREEDPARFLAVVAGAAFVIGAGLRIWRSRSND